jgi:hypothetical protein
MKLNAAGQFTTEYLVIIGIALTIIVAFLVYVFIFYGSYYSSSVSNQVTTVANAIVQGANYVSSEGVGSKTSLTIDFPLLENISGISSYFCGSYVKISSSTYSSIAQANVDLEGLLPSSAGNYVVYATYASPNLVQIGLNAPITYINSTYTINVNSLTYNLSFFNASYLPAASTKFNLSIFSPSGSLIKSVTGTANAKGFFYNSVTLTTVLPEFIMAVFPSTSSGKSIAVVAPSCFAT